MVKSTLVFASGMALTAALGASASADVIVNWDGTGNDVIPSANQNITQVTTFTTASFQSPAQGAAYYPAGAQNNPGEAAGVNFYSSIDNTLSANGWNLFNGGANDLLGRAQLFGGAGTDVSSLLAWDFNADLDALTNTGFNDFGANLSNFGYRFIIQDSNGDWFASATEFTAGDTIADASAASWLAFTPHVAGVATVGAAAAPVSFDGVQRVGYYQEFDTTGGGGVFSTGFNAEGVIPEPGSFALLGLGGLAILRRRK